MKKLISLILISLFTIAFSITANAIIKNVPSQFSTIQSAINSSSNGDTILVQPGTYTENINFRGKKIVLTSKFYQNNDYSFIQSTIINGGTPVFPGTASCVIINNQEDSTTVLQGFTITGGKGTKWTDEQGAGLYREGGGVLVAFSNPVIQNNIITGNNNVTGGVASTGGGGIRIGNCYCRLYNNIITNNSARYGAGVVLNYAGGEYKNNVIYKNFGSQDYGSGSGLWINHSFSRPKVIENNTIVLNTAISGTAGLYTNNQVFLRNKIIWSNTSSTSAQITGSGMIVTYSNIQGGFSGAGNINVDPSFDSTNYYIKSSSLCVDKGDSSVIYNDPSDTVNPSLAKFPSKGGLRNDIGAYGGQRSKVIANTLVSIKGQGIKFSPDNFYLNQNYPNPFNPNTIINYTIPLDARGETQDVKLIVYNSLGMLIATLVDEKQNAGNYNVSFNGNNLSSGVYFYKLVGSLSNPIEVSSQIGAVNFTETKQMILLK